MDIKYRFWFHLDDMLHGSRFRNTRFAQWVCDKFDRMAIGDA